LTAEAGGFLVRRDFQLADAMTGYSDGFELILQEPWESAISPTYLPD
jgi:hypothetical protein